MVIKLSVKHDDEASRLFSDLFYFNWIPGSLWNTGLQSFTSFICCSLARNRAGVRERVFLTRKTDRLLREPRACDPSGLKRLQRLPPHFSVLLSLHTHDRASGPRRHTPQRLKARDKPGTMNEAEVDRQIHQVRNTDRERRPPCLRAVPAPLQCVCLSVCACGARMWDVRK